MAVYITQEVLRSTNDGALRAQYDFSQARKFGELQVLVAGNMSLVSSVPVVRALKEKLKSFSDDDYLLAVGDPGIVATASMIAAKNNYGRVKLLKWDRVMTDYIPISIDISGREI